MSKTIYLPFIFLTLFFANQLSALPIQPSQKKLIESETPFLKDNQLDVYTLDDFLTMTPKKYKELTGKKLKFKEVIALKLTQKKVKKEIAKSGEGEGKSQLIALLLAILIGGLGIHRFYLGYTGIGIAQLLTLGGCGIWALIDLIRIAMGTLGPADGSDYDPEL